VKDELQQNYGTMVGTPALVAGALREDANQALQFNGSTNSMSVPDTASSSLAIADGAPGGMALECFVKFASFPGTTKNVIVKPSSYALAVTSAGKLTWTLSNGANTVIVTSASTLSTATWYHVVGVYNGDYTGAPIFGNQTQGASQATMPGDYALGSSTGHNNLQVSKETILEKGLVTSVVMDLQKAVDATLYEWVAAVVYEDSAGVPGAKIAQSAAQNLGAALTSRQWVTFPVNGVAQPGPVWLGYVGGSNSNRTRIGQETTGGTRKWRNDSVTETSGYTLTGETPDPFGSIVSGDSGRFAIYANYTPLARTGDEGYALLYINGVEDAKTAYAHGIADSSSATDFASTVACSIDEPSIWNKKLTAVQVATHFAAR
jgi:hypothetical protein